MLWTEMLKLNAICEQEPSLTDTVYSNGGCRVAVGVSVAGKVAVAVSDGVGDSLGVGVSSVENVCGSFGTRKNVRPTATAITTNNAPMAAGRLRVNFGMDAACTERSVFWAAAFASVLGANSVPHTRQRTAFSLRRVPQVGQTFVLLGFDS